MHSSLLDFLGPRRGRRSPFEQELGRKLPVLRQSKPPPVLPLPPTPLPKEFQPSSYSISATPRGTFSAVVSCSWSVAEEFLHSDYSWLSVRDVDLDRLTYNGTGVVVETPSEGAALLAALQLRLFLTKLARKDAADLTFTPDIVFLGEPRCAICLSGMKVGQRVRKTRCLHLFHSQCLTTWLRTRKVCPIDKTALF